jgi:type II secretory ATPase GspE/PulE/Tfp pilus assembly ATPase PilB-like protein
MQPQSTQQKLKQRLIPLETALTELIDPNEILNLPLLDEALTKTFFKQLRLPANALPVIPLFLWQNCYYLGSPTEIPPDQIVQFESRLHTAIQILPISSESYGAWFSQHNLIYNPVDAEVINPHTGETEKEDISRATEFSLARSDSQVERIQTIIVSALRNRASDIHLEPSETGLQVRYRIDGILRHITTIPLEYSRRVVVALKAMCDMDIADSRRPQDGRISEQYTTAQQQDQGLDLRVSTIPCVSNRKGESEEKAVLRLLRQQNSHQSIQDLGFSAHTRALYQSWLEQPQGMIILTGPTGSGKTSTLYTSLRAIAQESVNIITVEDPVEYVLPGITQTQVNEAAGMTFSASLRAILRQDPDVVMIGEVRDPETAETAVRAALTGHLVFTTLHTNDAVGAIPRLKDIGPDPGLISDALLGIIAQRLVRRVCPHCAEAYTPTAKEANFLGLSLSDALKHNWRKGRGCAHCFNSGYLGREAVMEVLHVDDTIRQIIYEGSITDLRHYLQTIGFASFRAAAIEKINAGLTTLEEVKRVLPMSALNPRTAFSAPASAQLSAIPQAVLEHFPAFAAQCG